MYSDAYAEEEKRKKKRDDLCDTLGEIAEAAKEILNSVESCKTPAEAETNQSLPTESAKRNPFDSLRSMIEQAGNEAVKEGAPRVQERLAAKAKAEGATISTST